MLVLFVSKILCSVMNLTIFYYVLFTQFLPRPAKKESNVYTKGKEYVRSCCMILEQ